MGFTIEADGGKREDFAAYRYRILRDGQLVANYWCDYRGDDHGIEFPDGTSASWPVGSVLAFIQGGGAQPLRLTDEAMAFLAERVPAATRVGPPPPPRREPVLASTSARPGRNRRLLLALALLCWLASLFLPPLVIADRDSSNLGIGYPLTRWMGPLAWFAAPAIVLLGAMANLRPTPPPPPSR